MFRQFALLMTALLVSITTFAQDITVKGIVQDKMGPIVGANVHIKGTTTGTITGMDGDFTIVAPRGSILVVSFIGYQSKEVTVSAPMMEIELVEDALMLDNVVVIGYGSVKKTDMTGSVTAIKPDKMNRGLVTNAQDMMAGKIAGVSVISDGGTPGGGAQIRVRGGSSLSASNDPLIVIDGLAMDNTGVQGLSNPLSVVNPADIESFTVLKDASATAIYGSRASNGVIIITTKKGEANSRPRFTYNGNAGISFLTEHVDVLSGDEYRAFIAKQYGEDSDAYRTLGTANTDWQKEIYRTAFNTDHNFTVTGGYKNIPYRATIGYTNQSGVLKTSNFQRYTASLSVSPSFFENHLKVNANLKAMLAKNRFADGGAVGAAVRFDPTQPIYVDGDAYAKSFDGYFQWLGTNDIKTQVDPTWALYPQNLAPGNPVSLLDLKDDTSKAKSLIGNIELDYKFHVLPELRWHMNGGMDLSTGKQTTNVAATSFTNNYYGSFGFTEKDKRNLSFSTYLQYMKEHEAFRYDVMAGYEWQHFYNKGNKAFSGFYQLTATKNAGEPYQPTEDEWKNENYLVSFFGRANFTLLERYLFTATLRRDGSSRFHKNNRWGTFPSFAFAWKVNEEPFLKNIKEISDLKLRLGYGLTGQQGLNDAFYEYIPKYLSNVEGAYYPIVGDGKTSSPSTFNENLKWEKTTTYNVGIDLGLWDNRITLIADAYYRKTTDLLNKVYIPAATNFGTMLFKNIGSMENRGFEIAINAKPIVSNDLTWDLNWNLTYNTNKITNLIDGSGAGYYVPTGGISVGTGTTIQAHAVGHPMNSFFVYQQVYDKAGKPIQNAYVDRNGDGVLTDADRYFYKKPSADVLMGLSSKVIYKDWDFNFTLRASLNNYVYNDVQANNSDLVNTYSPQSFLTNKPRVAFDPNFPGTVTKETAQSDYFVQNASFLKLDNITVGYSFKDLFNRGVNGRVFGTIQNVFTITKYKGLDPEINNGIDNNIYPRPTSVLFGVNLNF